MANGLWTPTNSTLIKILNGQFNWAGDSFKVALFQSTSNLSVTSTTFAGVTNQVATANGYTAGGIAVTIATLSGTTSVDVKWTVNPEWVVVTAPLVFRWACLYEVGGDVAFFALGDDTPADVSTPVGNHLILDNDGTPQPIFNLAVV